VISKYSQTLGLKNCCRCSEVNPKQLVLILESWGSGWCGCLEVVINTDLTVFLSFIRIMMLLALKCQNNYLAY
jgi:hypothetical protein